MMALMKAMLPGSLLTFIIAMIFGTNGSSGEFLQVYREMLAGYDFYWSWPLFVASTGIGWGLYAMME
jgi:hypothetical protein